MNEEYKMEYPELISKSIRMEKPLADRILADGKREQRNFTQQLMYIAKKYYEIQDNFKK